MQTIIPDEIVNGKDNVLILAVGSSSTDRIREILQRAIDNIDKHGKPIQGTVSSFGAISYVSTPVWGGEEY